MYPKTDTKMKTETNELVVVDTSIEINPMAVFLCTMCPGTRMRVN
jgi:hypothetical protein